MSHPLPRPVPPAAVPSPSRGATPMIRRPQGEVAMAVEALERAISSVSVDDLPALSGELERLRATALVRMVTPQVSTPSADTSRSDEDRYLTMRQVNERTRLSLSHLYEMARTGELPVKPMGCATGGKKPRGYRVLLSDLRAWERSRGSSGLDNHLSSMLISSHDRRRGAAASTAARDHAGTAREAARRPSGDGKPMGKRLADAEGRRRAAPAADADPAG